MLRRCFALAVCVASLAALLCLNGGRAPARAAGKIRVGYVQGEEYYQFGQVLCGIAYGMLEVGLISELRVSPQEDSAAAVWDALARCESASFEFLPEYFYTMKEMDPSEHGQFVNRPDVDLVFVNGTIAGVFFTEHETSNDYMVFGSLDPITAGITKSAEERLKQNAYTYCDLGHMARQVEIAYNIFHFTKMGVVYEDSPSAYAYSGIGQVHEKAREHGFDVLELHVDESRGPHDDARYYADLKAAYQGLIDQGIDALYITVATTAPEMLPWLLEDIQRSGIVTLSQSGGEQLAHGAVLGVTQNDFPDEGRHIGRLLLQYAQGAPIHALPQRYEIVPRITLNYDALTASNLALPFRLLLMFDEIIRTEAMVDDE